MARVAKNVFASKVLIGLCSVGTALSQLELLLFLPIALMNNNVFLSRYSLIVVHYFFEMKLNWNL